MSRFHRCALLSGLGVLAVGAILAGCAKAPTDEINAAQATIDSVKALPVVQSYGMDQVRAAEQALAAVRQQVEEKKYAEARAALPSVVETARGAVAAAEAKKAEMDAAAKQAAMNAIGAAKQAVGAAQGKLAKLRGAARTALQNNITAANALVTEAQTACDANDFAGATAKAQEASAKVAQPAPAAHAAARKR